MREIKFRAWDEVTKSWAFIILKNKANFFPEFPKECDSRNFSGWMQYSELKDKKGKEVWEGDIIKKDGSEWVWVVLLKDGKFHGETINPMLCVDYFFSVMEMLKETEVIGNIYGNPELLKL